MIGLTSSVSSSTFKLRVRLFSFPAASLKSKVIVYVPAVVGVHFTEDAVLKFETTEVAPLAFVTENL